LIIVMKQQRIFDASLINRLLAWLVRLTGVALATFIVLLCLPFLDPIQKEHEPKPQPPVAAEEPPRIGVKFRRGDTLTSVLARFGVKPPSAYAIVDKMRPF
jgi:hypothetical protein